jgi:hypothetical protein
MNSNTGAVSKVTAPAANAALATLTGLAPNQQYSITVNLTLTAGAPAAADAANVKLLVGSTVLFTIANGITLGQLQQFRYTVTTDVNGTISLQAVGAATAGVVYQTQITADSGAV